MGTNACYWSFITAMALRYHTLCCTLAPPRACMPCATQQTLLLSCVYEGVLTLLKNKKRSCFVENSKKCKTESCASLLARPNMVEWDRPTRRAPARHLVLRGLFSGSSVKSVPACPPPSRIICLLAYGLYFPVDTRSIHFFCLFYTSYRRLKKNN